MPQGELRIWSAACASGEEAYSLAMLALEVAEQVGFTGGIKVFATDAQQKVLDQAVRGRYSAEALSRVPAARLRRWFVSDGDGSWRVTAELRRCVVFARHNLLVDPPFTRIDLVLCRNLLIYLRPEAQLLALSQLHFALQSKGLLLLGSSEGVGRLGQHLHRGDGRPRDVVAHDEDEFGLGPRGDQGIQVHRLSWIKGIAGFQEPVQRCVDTHLLLLGT